MSVGQNYLLGIDLGTTNVKAIILNENGTVCASASAANHLIFPGPDMVEQDPAKWWDNTAHILRTITSAVGPEVVSRIRGICVSSQTVTMLPVDRNGEPLRNALIWMDGRSYKELDFIRESLGNERFISIIGAQPDVAFLPNKLLWFKKNEPELFARTYKILQVSSYINYKLTGKMTMDVDQAARCQCLELRTLKWSRDIAGVIGIDLDAILPTPQLSTEIIGGVTPQAAAATGLISGIPVLAGASDAMASMYASGLCRLGEAGESSGTSSLVFIGHSQGSDPSLPVVAKPCSIDGMPYVFDAPITSSGSAIKWYLDNLGAAEYAWVKEHGGNVYDRLNAMALDAAPGSGGLLFFPYLHGERAPLWNSHARGMFIGLSLDTKREDMVRAIFEGTAFALRHVMDTIKEAGAKASCLRITGGGAKSRTWCRIKASVLRMPVYILDEGSGDVPFGDCLIAGQAAGVFTDLGAAIDRLIKVKEEILPDEQWAQVYDELYPYYIQMYRSLDKDLARFEKTMEKLAH